MTLGSYLYALDGSQLGMSPGRVPLRDGRVVFAAADGTSSSSIGVMDQQDSSASRRAGPFGPRTGRTAGAGQIDLFLSVLVEKRAVLFAAER
ncbi:MAG: hypothetical protein QOH48_914 [Actinomycetota bacterium]|nr:hypothetical protein [Actinomycetota bacterium]